MIQFFITVFFCFVSANLGALIHNNLFIFIMISITYIYELYITSASDIPENS